MFDIGVLGERDEGRLDGGADQHDFVVRQDRCLKVFALKLKTRQQVLDGLRPPRTLEFVVKVGAIRAPAEAESFLGLESADLSPLSRIALGRVQVSSRKK